MESPEVKRLAGTGRARHGLAQRTGVPGPVARKPGPIIVRRTMKKKVRLALPRLYFLTIFFLYFLMILGYSHGRIGERKDLHALPHLVRPRSLGCPCH